jgi:holo-[acyl-carrier-protein] synthase
MKERVTVAVVWHGGPPGLRVGVDVVRRGRLQSSFDRFGPRFARTIFHPREDAAISDDPERCFAAKEALVKALGIGIVSGVELTDIDTAKANEIEVHGTLRLVFSALDWRSWMAPLDTAHSVGAVVWVG